MSSYFIGQFGAAAWRSVVRARGGHVWTALIWESEIVAVELQGFTSNLDVVAGDWKD